MTIKLYQEVALTRDLPEYGLRIGDVASSSTAPATFTSNAVY